MAMALHFNEPLAELLDFRRETGHGGTVITLIVGEAVFQGTVGLFPSNLVPAGAGDADHQVSAAAGERMEHRIVGRADGTPQLSLSGPASSAADSADRQMPGDAK